MLIKEQRALLELFDSMNETATDIFWGENAVTEAEKDLLKPEDYEEAYKDASIEYLTNLIMKVGNESNWFDGVYLELSELYGKRIQNLITKRVLEVADEENQG